MERREALVTDRAVEHDQARQNRVHGQRRPERRFTQRHIELRRAKFQVLHGDDENLLV